MAKKHPDGGQVETLIHRHHDGVKTAKQRCQGEQVGQDVNTLAPLAQQHRGYIVG